MPKAILEFNLDDHHEREEFEVSSNARKYLRILQNIEEDLRRKTKYNHDLPNKTYEDFKRMLYAALDEEGVELW